MSRHAYLIMVHHNLEQLYRLMQFLDSKDTDIYLHLDRKATGFDAAEIRRICSMSRVLFLLPQKTYIGRQFAEEMRDGHAA